MAERRKEGHYCSVFKQKNNCTRIDDTNSFTRDQINVSSSSRSFFLRSEQVELAFVKFYLFPSTKREELRRAKNIFDESNIVMSLGARAEIFVEFSPFKHMRKYKTKAEGIVA